MLGEGQQLDTQIEIVTPENISFKYRVAGPFQRLPAYLLDVLVRLAIQVSAWLIISFVFAWVGLIGLSIMFNLILWFVLDAFYGGLFEALWNGQTPGKRWTRLRVLTVDGQPIHGWQAVLRNVLRFVDSLPAFRMMIPSYLLGLVTSATNDRFQRLGDLVAGTMVVVEEPQRRPSVTKIDDPQAIRLAAELPTSFQASRTLARALSNYVQRRQSFHWPRRQEIASHLALPLAARLNLPAGVNPDLLLCALYYRTFIADRPAATSDRQGITAPTAVRALQVVTAEGAR